MINLDPVPDLSISGLSLMNGLGVHRVFMPERATGFRTDPLTGI
jgi:hypothetical protein